MDVADLKSHVWTQLDEDPLLPVTPAARVLAKLNQAQRLFAFFTFAIERRVTWTVPAATPYVDVLETYPDFIAPLRLTLNGARIATGSIAQLNALDETWEVRPGTIKRYGVRGCGLVYVSPQPEEPTPVEMLYAAMPAPLVNDGNVPEIPAGYHAVLHDYAAAALRTAEGGEQLARMAQGLQSFLASAFDFSSKMRARSLSLRYDFVPPELERVDLSRVLKFRGDILPARKEMPWPPSVK